VVAVVTGAVVATCGIVGWIGLLAPHLARMLVGPAHRYLLPSAALTGALILIVVDTLARTLTAAEVPLSVLTAVLGTPVFAVLLNRLALQGWNRERD
jgi:iron complex transport system permease protein